MQRLRLLERVNRVVADPDELEPGFVHAFLDHMVERVLHPGLERNQPFLRRLLAQVSLVARLTWLTNGETGTEKA